MDLLNAMDLFVKVVDAGSLSRAARLARRSVAGISRQLAALERELATQLLVRTTRTLVVTDQGRRFYQAALTALRAAEHARAQVARDDVLAGALTVSMPVIVGLQRAEPLILSFVRAHPRIGLDVRLEDHAVDVIADGVDVAVRVGLALPDQNAVIARALGSAPRFVVASPTYLRRAGVPRAPHDLAGHRALVHAAAGDRWRLHRGADAIDVAVTGWLRSTSLALLQAAALAHEGVALLPGLLVEDHLATGALRALPLDGFAPPAHTFFAITRAEARAVRRIDAYVAHLRGALATGRPHHRHMTGSLCLGRRFVTVTNLPPDNQSAWTRPGVGLSGLDCPGSAERRYRDR